GAWMAAGGARPASTARGGGPAYRGGSRAGATPRPGRPRVWAAAAPPPAAPAPRRGAVLEAAVLQQLLGEGPPCQRAWAQGNAEEQNKEAECDVRGRPPSLRDLRAPGTDVGFHRLLPEGFPLRARRQSCRSPAGLTGPPRPAVRPHCEGSSDGPDARSAAGRTSRDRLPHSGA